MTLSNEDRALLERFVVNNSLFEELEAQLVEFNIFEAVGVESHWQIFLTNDLPAIRKRLEQLTWPDPT